MELLTAREIKAELRRRTAVLAAPPRPHTPTGGVAVGVCVVGPARYGVAVRTFGPSELADEVIAAGRELAGDECDIRDVGVVRAQQWEPGELQGRHRPLRPGLSVAHLDVTAGTIGGFVVDDSGAVLVLSNNHVLADSDRGAAGDVVVQPGPADGGAAAADRIGVLDGAVALDEVAPNLVDAATARLDDGVEISAEYPGGALTGWVAVTDDIAVEKAGRTTGVTQGRVSAIEIDGISVQYPSGVLDFDDQLEVTGTGSSGFSAGGDSGSLVYRPDTREAIGLLFAGSDTGGPNGQGLTYCNPIGTVLERLGVRLA
ncbi:chymotrypsin family serine protease [Jiangella alkaliphila]|uniref:Trypsin-like peptidase domain-containing protein n=1 Tax=Jiangella alkaliphila TaxID=419479 RepID=A0A1H2M465_9ACTN|nr:hypothetical protein [Jiangella alkaliphila]SDU88057.1 hypothetical protein SAMN04488563_7054 [Jiangella alkaliphila]